MSLVPSIQVLTDGRLDTEFHTPFEWFYVDRYMYKTWMEGTSDIPYKNSYS